MNEIRISLTAEDFEKLASGQFVIVERTSQPVVKLCLQDIGWQTMIDIINRAIQDGS